MNMWIYYDSTVLFSVVYIATTLEKCALGKMHIIPHSVTVKDHETD